jgi:leucyl-tRNA synthetase
MMEENQAGEWQLSLGVQDVAPEKSQLKVMHATIKKVTEDIETLSFNTAISQMMVFVNEFTNAPAKAVSAMRTLLVLLNPFAPHVTSELWQQLAARFPGVDPDITKQDWPAHDPAFLIEDEVEIVLQVNGRVRDKVKASLDASDAELEQIALTNARVKEFIAGKQIRKIVVVRNKLVNVVAN